MILVVSYDDDAHLPYVLRHVTEKTLLVDPAKLVEGRSVDYAVKSKQHSVFYEGKPLRNVKAVWYRRPTPVTEVDFKVSDEALAYARSAVNRQTLAFNYMFQDAFWVSNFHAIVRANIKPLQLSYALNTGFNVPDTLFVSNKQLAAEFMQKHSICIAKPQATEYPKGKAAYASIIHAGDTLNLSGLRYDPYILQQYIRPSVEYRVNVVGDEVFVASILSANQSDAEARLRDWRTSYKDGSFDAKEADLPATVKKACAKLVKSFGLAFGAIDLIEDERGKIWFLEINPNGQWAFIEVKTKLPIGKAIARLLSQ